MTEVPDFSKYERDDTPIPGLSPDDMAFLAGLDTQADELFSTYENPTSEDLELCKQAYLDAINQRTDAITAYMQDRQNPALMDHLRAYETQLFAQFCEYVDVLLHAPIDGYGPNIVTELAGALSLADSSQMQINMQAGDFYQFDVEKLQQSILYAIMAAKSAESTQAVMQQLYTDHIHDVVMNFIDNNS